MSTEINNITSAFVSNLSSAVTTTSIGTAEISKEMRDFNKFYDLWWLYIEWIQFPLCFLGISSSILTLIILYKSEHFSEPCFICYQGIALSELIYAITNAVYYWYDLRIYGTPLAKTYAWQTIRYPAMQTLFTFCNQCGPWLICFLSFQRFVACLLPNKFRLVNGRNLCLCVTVGAFVVAFADSVPNIFAHVVIYDNKSQTYDHSTSESYRAYLNFINYHKRLIETVVIIVTTTLAICGMLKAIAVRRRLFRQTQNQQQSNNNEALKSVKRNLQLCILQLSQAIPMVAHRVIAFVGDEWYAASYVYDNAGLIIISYTYRQTVIWGLDYMIDSVEHYFHFYLYVTFSKGFREGFAKKFRKIGPALVSQTARSNLARAEVGRVA